MSGTGRVHHLAAAMGAGAVLRRLHRWLLPDTVSVVSYHGLVDAPLPVPGACFMPVGRFAAQLEYLARHFTVLHLEDAFAPDRPRSERPVACITFDDGFGCLHDLATPVLERLALPSTVYLVTDLIDSEQTLWYARLHRAVCETAARELQVGERRFPLGGPQERAQASAALQELLKALPRPRFGGVFEEVLERLGASRAGAAWGPMRALRTGEIRRMSQAGLVRFGSHTASHQILTRTDPEDARREIRRSVAAVAAIVERPSRTFAYPNGGADDFDAGTVAALREVGIDYAVTTIEGPNARGEDPYRIRRYAVSAVEDPARFAYQVHHGRAVAERISRVLRRGAPGSRQGRIT